MNLAISFILQTFKTFFHGINLEQKLSSSRWSCVEVTSAVKSSAAAALAAVTDLVEGLLNESITFWVPTVVAQILGTPRFVETKSIQINFPPPFLEVSRSLGADLWIYDVAAAWWMWFVRGEISRSLHFGVWNPQKTWKPFQWRFMQGKNIFYSFWTLDALENYIGGFTEATVVAGLCNPDRWNFSQSMNVPKMLPFPQTPVAISKRIQEDSFPQ